jgi:hypothetical protein
MENNKKSFLIYIPTILMVAAILYPVLFMDESYILIFILLSPFVLPIFTILGAFGVFVAFKKKTSMKKWYFIFLLILSFSFIAYVPAVLIIRGADYVIHLKSNLQRGEQHRENESQRLIDLKNKFSEYVPGQAKVIDVYKDRILVNEYSQQWYLVLKVTNAKEIGLFEDPESFKNKTVSISLDEANIPSDLHFFPSEEGVVILSRNVSNEKREELRTLEGNEFFGNDTWYDRTGIVFNGDVPVVIQ